MSDLSFGRPLVLLALPLVPVIAIVWWLGVSRGAILARRISRAVPVRPVSLPAALLLLTAALAIVAAALPRWGTEDARANRFGAELVVVLDVSRSMDARDVTPSRLEAAKATLLQTFGRIGGDRVGLIVYAGSGRLRFPLTTDLQAASDVVRSLETGSVLVEGGSRTSSGLDLAIEAFDPTSDTGKVILLITDGDDLGNDPASTAVRLRESSIELLVAGAGTTDGATVPVYNSARRTYVDLLDASGRPVVSRLEEPFLRSLATAAGGRYLGSDLSVVPGAVSARLNTLEQARLEDRTNQVPVERFPIFAALALGTLVLASVAEHLPRFAPRRAALGATALLLLLLGSACATEAHRLNDDARRAFKSGDFARAAELFQEARVENPADYRITLNLALALHAAERYEEAATAARRALNSRDPAIRAEAFASLGHHQFAAGQLEEALESFKQALLLNPDDDDTRHDYEVVLRLLSGESEQGETAPSTPGTGTPSAGEPGTGTPAPGDPPSSPAPNGPPSQSQTPQPGQTPPPGATPEPGQGGNTPPGDRPATPQELDRQLNELDRQIAALLDEAGEQPTAEQALQLLRLIAERSRIAALRDSFGGNVRPDDY